MSTHIATDGLAADIKNVTVLGTGVLGSQIAFQTAYSGFQVTAYDVDERALESAKDRFHRLADRYAAEVDGAVARIDGTMARLAYSCDLAAAVRNADLVIEAVPERLDLKRQVYEQLGAVAPAHTIFATNSSTLLPSSMAEFTGRPERFLALHFANEIWISNTAEIMGHHRTDPAI